MDADKKMYVRFGASLAASWIVMYGLAFSQIDVPGHFHWSLSVFWISMTMVASMGLIMMLAMGGMFKDQRINMGLYALFAVLLLSGVSASRTEALVDDDAFLRSMIPHHSRAIHMCQEATLEDTQVKDLCGRIIEAQREEIAEMEAIMDRR